MIDGYAVLSLTGRNFEASAHWSVHGLAVLFLGGNSEGVHAARQVVRSNCFLVRKSRLYMQETLIGAQIAVLLGGNSEGL